ncbi:MAG: hypothetical protein KatS3mg103_0652 [Phycisphaerales bacterium]|nr:MAG: hypothetical protein KatS3mg103_0652 [Phycisphaerales bacterium]
MPLRWSSSEHAEAMMMKSSSGRPSTRRQVALSIGQKTSRSSP